jgi:hypothetical protein
LELGHFHENRASTAAALSGIGPPGAADAVLSWASCPLGAPLEGLVEGAEIGLGLGDGLAGERDKDAAHSPAAW